jgi:hypothetical protein
MPLVAAAGPAAAVGDEEHDRDDNRDDGAGDEEPAHAAPRAGPGALSLVLVKRGHKITSFPGSAPRYLSMTSNEKRPLHMGYGPLREHGLQTGIDQEGCSAPGRAAFPRRNRRAALQHRLRRARLDSALVSEPESAELLTVDCECAADCGEEILVTAAEYAAAHREADYVLVRPGHPVEAGSRGARVVEQTDRYCVIAEGWALMEDEVSPQDRARLAELRAQSFFTVSCECAQCEAGLLADAAQVQITLDEWDRVRDMRLIKTGHATDGGGELERNERFVVVDD